MTCFSNRAIRSGAIAEELDKLRAPMEQGSWRQLFQPGIRWALVIGMSLQMFQQLAGINTAMYYSATILKQGGESDTDAIYFSDSVAATNALFTVQDPC